MSRKELQAFMRFPYLLNKTNQGWVPPLWIAQKQLFDPKHLFWQHNPYRFFLAYQGEQCVGRVAAFINQEHNQFHSTREGCFGFLECENNPAVFKMLLASAEEFTQGYNCTAITGPLNPSLHYELGVLVDGFEHPPFFMLTHNASYYDERIKESGYSGLKDFYAYQLVRSQYVPTPKMLRVRAFLEQRHKIRIRTAEIKSFDKELDVFHAIYNDAFMGHWGFTPMNREEFHLLAKDLKTIIDPRLVLIAEANSEPVAFLLCVPNFNEIFSKIRNGKLFPFGLYKILAGRKSIKSVRVILAAVKKSHEHLGLGALLYPELMKRALELGYHKGELSWVVEDNLPMRSIAEGLGAERYKTYRLYTKTL